MKKILISLLLVIPVQSVLGFEPNSCPIETTPENIGEYTRLLEDDIDRVVDKIIDQRILDSEARRTAEGLKEYELRMKYATRTTYNKMLGLNKTLSGFGSSGEDSLFWVVAASMTEVPSELVRDYKIIEMQSEMILEMINEFGSFGDHIEIEVEDGDRKYSLFTLLEKNEEIRKNLRNIVLNKKSPFKVWAPKMVIDYYGHKVVLQPYEISFKYCTSGESLAGFVERVGETSWDKISTLWDRNSYATQEWEDAWKMMLGGTPDEERRLLEEYMERTGVGETAAKAMLDNFDNKLGQAFVPQYLWVDRISGFKNLKERTEDLLKTTKEKLGLNREGQEKEESTWQNAVDSLTGTNSLDQRLADSAKDLRSRLDKLKDREDIKNQIHADILAKYNGNEAYLSGYTTNKEILIGKIIEMHKKIEFSISLLQETEDRAIEVCESQAKGKGVCKTTLNW